MKKIIPGLEIPVNTIFCIGRNYANHAKEMNAPVPSTPMVFTKPVTTICFDGDTVHIPPQSNDVHHEGELVVAIGKSGKNIPLETALEYISGIGVGIDFTARDIQAKAKEKGHPWAVAKGFDHFAPISTFVPLASIPDSLVIQLSVNDDIRQQGFISDMIFDIPTLISYLSTIFTLNEGDLIFTGTPEGVAAVEAGDTVKAVIPELNLSVNVTIA